MGWRGRTDKATCNRQEQNLNPLVLSLHSRRYGTGQQINDLLPSGHKFKVPQFLISEKNNPT
jgi:hypothetical protein